MPNYTNNYSLIKPLKGENYDVNQTTNTNMDIIDMELFKRVEKQPGKGLSQNDFTDGYKFKIDTLSNLYIYKGAVDSIEDLPASGNRVRDVYSVAEDNASYAWDGTQWNSIGNIINLSEFFEIINEIAAIIGDLDDLATMQKSNIVVAINELVTKLGTKVNSSTYNSAINTINTALTNLDKAKSNNKYYESTCVVENNSIDFTIDSPTILEVGVEYKIHFATNNSSKDARLSVDNGINYYNINGCTGEGLSDEYLTVMYDGTKFLYMTDMGPSTIEYVQEEQNNE